MNEEQMVRVWAFYFYLILLSICLWIILIAWIVKIVSWMLPFVSRLDFWLPWFR